LNTQREEDALTTRNINFIKYSSNVLGSFVKFINAHCIELGEQVIDFLIDAVQGPCKENQLELREGKIVEFIKDF